MIWRLSIELALLVLGGVSLPGAAPIRGVISTNRLVEAATSGGLGELLSGVRGVVPVRHPDDLTVTEIEHVDGVEADPETVVRAARKRDLNRHRVAGMDDSGRLVAVRRPRHEQF